MLILDDRLIQPAPMTEDTSTSFIVRIHLLVREREGERAGKREGKERARSREREKEKKEETFIVPGNFRPLCVYAIFIYL